MSHERRREAHVSSFKIYVLIGCVLLVLTAVTVWAAGIDFGRYNLVIAMIIAFIKGSLVGLYFMHLKYDYKLYSTVFVFSLLFLAVFITLTMFDTLARGDIDAEMGKTIVPEAVIYKEMEADVDEAVEEEEQAEEEDEKQFKWGQ